jgi:hypothetical protein
MSILAEILLKDRWIRIANSKVQKSPNYSVEIADIISNHLTDYASFYGLSAEEIIKIYNNFTRQYSEHIRVFLSIGNYPFQDNILPDLKRIDYDIVLILSVVLSIHRHKIFVELHKSAQQIKGNVLLIGIGSGVELDFLNNLSNDIKAYDISISDFIKKKYIGIELNETFFEGDSEKYSNIFAVELLEHLSQPIDFVKMAYESLTYEGKFYFTTATNIPQIDHLYNFNDKNGWEQSLKDLGFDILVSEQINHESIDSKLLASNTWYITKK